jgi:hypothetical protein
MKPIRSAFALPGRRFWVQGFQVSRWCALIAGYRALGYNFWQNDTNLNLISHGPYAGIEITF